MAGRNLLVVTASGVDTDALRGELRRHVGEETARVRVVGAASRISRLDWLMNDEDAERAEAQEMAAQLADAVGGDVEAEAELGDSDPVQAAEDALRTFPADEILLVTQPGDRKDWLEEGAAREAFDRFGLPVTHLVVGAAGEQTEAIRSPASTPSLETRDDREREVARAQSPRTPAFLLGSVATLVWGAAGVIALLAILLWLLIRS